MPKSYFEMSKEQVLQKLEHLMVIEYTETVLSYKKERVAIFDDRLISEKEVRAMLKSGDTGSPFVLLATAEQAKNVLGNTGISHNYPDGGKKK